MKLTDIENVNIAHRMLESITLNIRKLKSHLNKELMPDCGGIEGVFEYGYSCRVGKNSDGSGFNVDLTGCYVADQVYSATLDILEEQRKNVIEYLNSIGVEVDEKDFNPE